MIKTYHIYIVKNFLKQFSIITFVFLGLIFLLNILEEIKYFSKFDMGIYYPVILTLLNLPSVLFEIFPFIILITTQFFFLGLMEKDELIIFKNNGLSNTKILSVLTLVSLIIGLFLISFFYTFSSALKYNYLNIKSQFSKDNKYLALVNENGLWIKEEMNGYTNIINGDLLEENNLKNVTISQLDKNYNLEKMITAESVDITNNNWILNNALIFQENLPIEKLDKSDYLSNFNINKINNTFSNLSSQNILELFDALEDFNSLGYSTLEIKSYMHQIFSYPVYLTIMTMAGAILMFNIKKTKIILLIMGIMCSVVFYYIYYFSKVLGINEKVPIYLSAWLPHLFLFLICLNGVVRLNEK